MAITVNQIAEKCGVSRTTVLRALNGGSVSKETKERILQVAKDNNYRPNLLARSLNHGRTMSLGVVTINIENMYFVQSLNTINKEADKRGYFTNIVVCDDSLEWEKNLFKVLPRDRWRNIDKPNKLKARALDNFSYHYMFQWCVLAIRYQENNNRSGK